MKGPTLFQGEMITKKRKFIEPQGQFQPNLAGEMIKKKRKFIEPQGQFQPNLAKSIPGGRGYKFVQMERSHLLTMGDDNKIAKIAKIHSQNLKISSPSTTGPIL